MDLAEMHAIGHVGSDYTGNENEGNTLNELQCKPEVTNDYDMKLSEVHEVNKNSQLKNGNCLDIQNSSDVVLSKDDIVPESEGTSSMDMSTNLETDLTDVDGSAIMEADGLTNSEVDRLASSEVDGVASPENEMNKDCPEVNHDEPTMYICNIDRDSIEQALSQQNQNRRKRKGAVPKKIVKQELDSSIEVFSNYTCTTCDARFTLKKDLVAHSKIHNTKDPAHICSVCGEQFTNKKTLRSHFRSHRDENVLNCTTCGEHFTKKIELKRHMKIHTGPKKYPCELCGKVWNRKAEMVGHMRTHTGEKPYKCPTCGKGFGFRHHLKGHLLIHSGEKPYTCERCGRGFNDKSSMRRHIKIHDEEAAILEAAINGLTPEEIKKMRPKKIYERTHVCEFCGKAFIKGQHLKVHIRTHTGEKPHQCQVCGKQFNDPSSFRRHVKTYAGRPHGNNTETVKEYKCGICNREFGYRRNYRNHLKLHANGSLFDCKTCGKKFYSQHNFRKHMTKHMVEKPYKCNICDKRFSNYSNWYCHSKSHSGKGVKRLSCGICGKQFITTAHLKCHLKVHKLDKTKNDKTLPSDEASPADIGEDQLEICKNCGDMFVDLDSLKQHDCPMAGFGEFEKVPRMDIPMDQQIDMDHFEKSLNESLASLSQTYMGRQFVAGDQVDINEVQHTSSDGFPPTTSKQNDFVNMKPDLARNEDQTEEIEDNYSGVVQKKTNEKLKEKITYDSLKLKIKLKPYPCTECNKSFHLKSSLTTHFKIHTGENLHECGICGKIFTKKYNYTRHMRSCESKNGVNESSDFIEMSFDEDGHPIKKPKPFPCSHCNKGFSNKYSLTEHFRLHTGENVHECLVCGKIFPKLYNYKRHVQSCKNGFLQHRRSHDNKSSASMVDIGNASLDDLGNASLEEQASMEGFDSSLDGSSTFCDESSLNVSLQNKTEGPHVCYVCSEPYPTLKTLKQHMQSHTKEEKQDKTLKKPYQCSECDKSFSEKGTLVTHFRLHTGKNLLECDVCGKKFTKNYNFLRHVRTHTGDKPHKCDHCTRSFGDGSSLARHMAIKHSEIATFACHLCSARFPTEEGLEQHLQEFDHSGSNDMHYNGKSSTPTKSMSTENTSENFPSPSFSFFDDAESESEFHAKNHKGNEDLFLVQVKLEPEDP